MGIPVEEFDATDGVLPTGVPVTLDVRGKHVVIPTGDEAVQIGRNEWQVEYPVGVTYHPGTILVSGGDNVSIETIDGAESGTVLNHVTTGAHGDTLYHDHEISVRTKIVNDGVGENVVVVEQFDAVGTWEIIDGTGTLSVSDSKLVVTGTTDENGFLRVRKEVASDFSGSEFICATLNSTLGCRAAHSLVSSTNEIQHYVTWGKLGTYGNRFDIEAGVDTRFVLPIDAPVGSVGSLPSYETGIFESNLIKWLYVGIAGAEPNSPCTLTIGQITLADSTPCTVELLSPISIPSDGVEYRCPASDPNEVFAVYDPTANELLEDVPGNVVFMDGTALSDFSGSHGFYGIGSGDETVSGVVYGTPATHTYPVAPDCAKFIAFTVDVPPSDDGRTYINEFTFDAVVPYTVFGYPCEGSPWGGAKEFSSPPDNMPGTVRILEGDNCYLMPVDQSVKSTVLHSGYLSEKGALTFDTEAHTMTEEFTIVNEGVGSDVTVIDDCSSIDGWEPSYRDGTLEITSGVNGVSFSGTFDALDRLGIQKDFNIDVSAANFIRFTMNPSVNSTIQILEYEGDGTSLWVNTPNAQLVANVDNVIVLPIDAPAGTTGGLPSTVTGVKSGTLTRLIIAIKAADESATCVISNITACNGTWATAEVAVPDELQIGPVDEKYLVECNTYDVGSSTYKRSLYHNIPNDTFIFRADGMYAMDGTCVRDILGVVNYVSAATAYELANANAIVTRETSSFAQNSPSSITYSSAHGTEKRIGFAILVPPSDNDRTDINKVQLKLVTYHDDGGKATIELADDDDLATGLQHMRYPVILIYDEATSVVDYYVSTGYLNSFKYTQDENGDISSIEIDPGNSIVYHGQTFHSGTSQDGDANGIPNFLEIGQSGSVLNYLKYNDFVRHLYNVYGLNVSIIANDFGITLDDVDIAPFSVSHGNPVYDADMNRLTPVETTDVEGGSVDTYDVKALSEVRVRDLPGNNAGDVTVWDTVTPGNTDESTWVQVTDVDHAFSGDCVVENGVCKFRIRVGWFYVAYSLYSAGGWATYRDVLYQPYRTTSIAITGLSTDSVTIKYTLESTSVKEITILRGSSLIYASPYYVFNGGRFIFYSGELHDYEFESSGYRTFTDNLVFAFDPESEYTNVISVPTSEHVYIQKSKIESFAAFAAIGALPISPVYVDKNNAILFGQYSIDGDTVRLLSGTNTYFRLDDVPAGTYSVWIRCTKVPEAVSSLFYFGDTLLGPPDEMGYKKISYTHPGGAIFIRPQYSSYQLDIQYVTMIETDAIQQVAERSLVQIDTAKTVLKLPR